MIKAGMADNLIGAFCKEYQALWMIDVNDHSMSVFYSNEDKCIPNIVDDVLKLSTYEEARDWYVENCIVQSQRKPMKAKTDFDVIMKETSGGKPYYIEYNRINGGVVNYNQLHYDRLLDDAGNTICITLGFRDIDMRRKAELDDVTGLLTRQAFFRRAEKMLMDNPDTHYDIVVSDIVDFKKINETYGVVVADKILKWIGDYLGQYMNDKVLVGRYGGDQMVVMGSHKDVAIVTSEEAIARYNREYEKSGLPSIITKFGYYQSIRHDSSIVSSCDKAHIALNSIKGHYDKVHAYYDDDLKQNIDKQRRIENSMHKSLEDGDFKVYYQPKHDARTGELVGAEALIRWIHPEYGFMSPADFIPMFERNGFVVENDEYVWKRTCENLSRWRSKGISTVPISINFSKLTIQRYDLINKMQESVRQYDVSANNLHIEITETLMTDDINGLIEKLDAMRELGYQIELDDFGSGYSSINVLSMLPLDVVKLDMSFMQQFGNNKRKKVLEACVDLAKNLGFKTVSEGVELEEQRSLLSDLGVDAIQGYLYSRPLPEDEFEQYMMKCCS